MGERKYVGEFIDDWMSKSVVTLGEKKGAFSAATIMNEKGIGSVIIIHDSIIKKGKGEIVGIVTETDMVRKVTAPGANPENVKLADIMTAKPFVLESTASIMQASNLITQKRIKRIPITKNGALSGIFTITDLMDALVKTGKIYEVGELVKYIAKKKIGTKEFGNIVKAEKWMSPDVITCTKETSVAEVSKLMESYRVGDVVVMEGKIIEGIVTDTDIVRRVIAQKKNPEATMAGSIMSSPVVTAEPDSQLMDIAKVMSEKKIKRVVITVKDELKGLLSITDLADALIELNNFAHAHRIIDMLYEK